MPNLKLIHGCVYLLNRERYESALAARRILGTPSDSAPEYLFYCCLDCAIEDYEALVELIGGHPCGRCVECCEGNSGMCKYVERS